MKLHSEIYSFFPVNLILRRRCGPVIYAAVLCCSLLASEASITCSHHANKFMCTRQNSPAKAGAKLKGNSSTSKMISLCDFISWASGLGFSSAGKPSALATLWLTCEWRQWRATPVSPPQAGAVWMEERRRSLNLSFSFFSWCQPFFSSFFFSELIVNRRFTT